MKKKDAKLHPLLIPIIAVVIFICAASINLRTSVWFDEAYSAYLIRGSYSQIWDMTALDVHPPFYYFCLKTWSVIFGTSDFALRFMSVLFVAIGIVLAYYLFRRWFSEKTANLATIFLSLSPFLLRYSQEMRMYGLVFAIVIGATLVLDIALKDKKRWAWIVYAVLIALGMWTHYFTALAWLAHLAYIIYYSRKHGAQKQIFFAYPIAIILFAPWLPLAFRQFTEVQSDFWIPKVTAGEVTDIFSQGLFGADAADVNNWLVVFFIAVRIAVIYLVVKTWRLFTKKEKANTLFMLAMILLPPFFLILLSLPPFQPTYVARYVAYSIALIMPLLAVFLSKYPKTKKKTIPIALISLILFCAISGIIRADIRTINSTTRDIVTLVQELADDGETIFISTDEKLYYDAFFYETKRNPIKATTVDYSWGSLEPIRQYNQNNCEDIWSAIYDKDSFWYIFISSEKEPEFSDYTSSQSIFNSYYHAIHFTRSNK